MAMCVLYRVQGRGVAPSLLCTLKPWPQWTTWSAQADWTKPTCWRQMRLPRQRLTASGPRCRPCCCSGWRKWRYGRARCGKWEVYDLCVLSIAHIAPLSRVLYPHLLVGETSQQCLCAILDRALMTAPLSAPSSSLTAGVVNAAAWLCVRARLLLILRALSRHSTVVTRGTVLRPCFCFGTGLPCPIVDQGGCGVHR
jgi:hypothetical protein